MALLPTKLPWDLAQFRWSAILNAFISNPILNSIILPNVFLANGTTVVNHKLARKLQGWTIVRQRAAASIYDNQDSNQTPDATLVLVSNAAVSVDICVF